MKFLRGLIGYCVAGMIVMSVWGKFTEMYGIVGGWFAAFIIIGGMWFLNHYVGLIKHEDDSAFVDMAFGIAICGTMRDTFMKGTDALVSSLPTLLFVAIGAVIAGIVSALIEKDMNRDLAENDREIVEQNSAIEENV